MYRYVSPRFCAFTSDTYPLGTGTTPGIAPAAVRTVLRLIDGLFCYAVAFVTVLVSGKRQRLGDMAARTLVVRV